MPIVRFEIVTRSDAEPVAAATVQELTNALGQILFTPLEETWLRFSERTVEVDAERSNLLDTSVLPTFIEVSMFPRPGDGQIATQAEEIAGAVNEILGVPIEQLHIMWTPNDRGEEDAGEDRVSA